MNRFIVGTVVSLIAGAMGAALAQDTVQVGVITSVTGRFAEFGEQHRAGLQAALEDVNAAGGVNGAMIELVIEDDISEVNAALAAAEKLINQDVPIVMGAYSSSITNPLAQYFTRQERPFVVFTSADDSITRPGSDWVFRLSQPSFAYADILFRLFNTINAEHGEDSLHTIALIHGNGAFESAVADAVVQLADEQGFEIVEQQEYDQSGADFRPILNRFAAHNPDIVFMVSYAADSVALMRQIQEVGLDAKLYAGGAAGFALPGFIEGSGPAADGVFTATSWTGDVPFPGAPELFARLNDILGRTPSYHAAQGYISLVLAADVLSRAASFEPADVRQALAETNLSDNPYGTIHFEDYQGYRNQNPLPMVVQQIHEGEFVTVYVDGEVVGDIQFPTPGWDER